MTPDNPPRISMSETPEPDAEAAARFAETRHGVEARLADQHGAEARAWRVASVAIAIAALEALALIALAPFKTVVPYTLLVDRTTGATTVLKGLDPQSVTPDQAITQAQLAQYVVARESFDITTLAQHYRKVALWSAGEARVSYLAAMAAGSPQSPLSLYPRDALVTVTIESVAPTGPASADVRFFTQRRDTPQSTPSKAWYVAHIAYRYGGAPLTLADRLDNPLGFAVLRYRVDQEVVPEATAPNYTPAWTM